MIVLGCKQGDADWHAARAQHYCASDAPAAMGVSKYTKRSELLAKYAIGAEREIDAATQRRFDAGHEAEAAARPLAEAVTGELFPVVGTLEIDGLPLLASLDGITMLGDVIWENKLYNADLATQVRAGDLDPNYWAQIEHQLLVSGAERCYFTTSDGTADRTVGCWYEARPERRAQILAAWKQFREDAAAYVPAEVLSAPVVAKATQLPALSIRVDGSISLVDNLQVFGAALQAYVGRINRTPQSDQDFADLESSVKTLKAAEEALDAAEKNALGQTASIDQMRRVVAEYRDLARVNRLTVEKLVKAEKENRRSQVIAAGSSALVNHVADLNRRLGRTYMPAIHADFAGAVRGLKTMSSIQNAVDTELARAKIEANAAADRIEMNLRQFDEIADGNKHQFPDVGALALKPSEDFASAVRDRIAQNAAAEAKRLERIRAEEAAKAAARFEAAERNAAETKPAESNASSVPSMSQYATKNDMRDSIRGRINTRLDAMDVADLRSVLLWIERSFEQEAA